MRKIIKPSIFSRDEGEYECQYDWPEDCFVQCGGNGIVFTGTNGLQEALADPLTAVVTALAPAEVGQASPLKHYRTAFFEAFPDQPRTFIRGEGVDIAAAEESAWNKWQKICACPGHEFEARGYENGLGFCRHCNMSQSGAIAPHIPCFNCGELTWGVRDKYGEMWCSDCWRTAPVERMHEYQIRLRESVARVRQEEAWISAHAEAAEETYRACGADTAG